MNIEIIILEVYISILSAALLALAVNFFKLKRRFREAEKILAKIARIYIDMALIKVNVKLLDPKAKLPTFKKVGDSGADLSSIEDVTLEPGETRKIRTGIVVELPPLVELEVRPRSGISASGTLVHFGTVDCGYRGEISVVMTNLSKEPRAIIVGDRIAQAVIKPIACVDFNEVKNIATNTDRGTGGFGSTGAN